MTQWRNLTKRILENDDPKRMLDYFVDTAVEISGAERGMLLLRSSKGPTLNIESARNLDKESLSGREARLSFHIAQRTVDGEQTLLLDDATKHDGFGGLNSVYELGLRSVLSVPIWLDGETVGAIYVDSRFIPSAFGEKEAQLLETLADYAALFLRMRTQFKQTESLKRKVTSLEKRLENANEELEELKTVALHASSTPASSTPTDHSPRFPPMIGESEPMQRMYSVIQKVLDNDITVLIEGESGTGKELVARAIHDFGRRSEEPFVAVNCSSIPASLIESELFGHTKGAFTGAARDKKGLFEVAHNGTLFLDEVGDMPLEMQGKLLRTLQYGEIQPLGSPEMRKVDVRLVAATNHSLEKKVKDGTFRQDLFYRLNIVAIRVPPLRKRTDDIHLLVNEFIARNREQGFTQATGITPQALLHLTRYPWPGNVRELETALKTACLFCESKKLDGADFDVLQRDKPSFRNSSDQLYFEDKTLAEVEKDVILATLKANKGNKKRTAEQLNIDRRTLYNKLKLYGEM